MIEITLLCPTGKIPKYKRKFKALVNLFYEDEQHKWLIQPEVNTITNVEKHSMFIAKFKEKP